MKRVVDTPSLWESELVDDGGEDFCDGEGAFMFWGKFRISDGSFEISGFQPDFVSFAQGGKASTGVRGHDLSCEFVRS